jgi:hypothetical protein
MIPLPFPPTELRLKNEGGKDQVFDIVRRQWVRLTPEEWVRQHFIHYLINVKQYPSSLMVVEKELHIGELSRRFDLLVYDKGHQPWMLVECKSMDEPLQESVWQQAMNYSLSIPAGYIIILNGVECRGWRKEGRGLTEIEELPEWGCK